MFPHSQVLFCVNFENKSYKIGYKHNTMQIIFSSPMLASLKHAKHASKLTERFRFLKKLGHHVPFEHWGV
jgi:hypothetical protein